MVQPYKLADYIGTRYLVFQGERMHRRDRTALRGCGPGLFSFGDARCTRILGGWCLGRVVRKCLETRESVPIKAGYSSSLLLATFRTARKASWGMSTRPTRFMRFLPFFCFSGSLRLREMSPP